MQIAILCGGLATRLGNLAKDTPKSMIKINGKPFLEYQIELLKKQGITDIILCVGHLSEKIEKHFGNGKKYNVKLRYSYDSDPQLGPIGALKKAEASLENIFFTMYGDSYVFLDFKKLYRRFQQIDKLALITVYKNYDKYDKSNLAVKNGNVIKAGGKKTKDMVYVDYGVSIFRKKTLELIPKDTFVSTKDLFSKLIKLDELPAFEVKKRFYHIGTPQSIEEFEKYINFNKIP